MGKYVFSGSELQSQPTEDPSRNLVGNGSQTGKKRPSAMKYVVLVVLIAVGAVAAWHFLVGQKPVSSVTVKDPNAVPPATEAVANEPRSDNGRRIALSVGIDAVDPNNYNGSPMRLVGSVIDVLRFNDILKDAGFTSTVLENAKATWGNVQARLLEAAETLKEGDLFVMTISGHGGRHDIQGKKHECWCLYDRVVWDAEIVRTFAKFRRGVRVLIVNDQCHAGGVFMEKSLPDEDMVKESERILTDPAFPMLIQFAGCRAEQTSVATPEGSTWMSSLVRALDAYPNHDCTLRQWFDKAFVDPAIRRGRQDPQWVERGTVTDEFRNDVILSKISRRGN